MTTRRPDMKTASFPAVVAAKKVASAQLNYYRTMMAPTIEEPLPAEPVQEPVAKVELMMTGGNAGLATRIVEIDDNLRERLQPGQLLYATPPQRKPLTEKQINHILDDVLEGGSLALEDVARAVEAAHGIK